MSDPNQHIVTDRAPGYKYNANKLPPFLHRTPSIQPVGNTTIFSRAADVLHKATVTSLLAFTLFCGYKLIEGFVATHYRNKQWESDHPELTQQIRQKLEQEQAAKENRRR